MKIFKLYLRPKYLVPLVIGIIALITAIINSADKAEVHIEDSQLTNSPVIIGGENDITYETVPQVRPDARWLQMSLSGFSFTDSNYQIAEIYNVKVMLPNNEFAFIESVPRENVTIAYSNTGCSELEVVEAFKRPSLREEEVCWILKATCKDGLLDKNLEKGQRAINKSEECSKLEPISVDDSNKFEQR